MPPESTKLLLQLASALVGVEGAAFGLMDVVVILKDKAVFCECPSS